MVYRQYIENSPLTPGQKLLCWPGGKNSDRETVWKICQIKRIKEVGARASVGRRWAGGGGWQLPGSASSADTTESIKSICRSLTIFRIMRNRRYLYREYNCGGRQEFPLCFMITIFLWFCLHKISMIFLEEAKYYLLNIPSILLSSSNLKLFWQEPRISSIVRFRRRKLYRKMRSITANISMDFNVSSTSYTLQYAE